jgi:hypothetical protein
LSQQICRAVNRRHDFKVRAASTQIVRKRSLDLLVSGVGMAL